MKELKINIDDDTYENLRKDIRKKLLDDGTFGDNANKFLNYILIAFDRSIDTLNLGSTDNKIYMKPDI